MVSLAYCETPHRDLDDHQHTSFTQDQIKYKHTLNVIVTQENT